MSNTLYAMGEDCIEDIMRMGHGFAETVRLALGYDVLVDYEICHTLQRNRPHVWAERQRPWK